MSWLKSARMADGAVVDVEIADGRVSRVVPAASAQAGGAGTDLAGYLLLPSFVEPHAHLDKALLGGHATVSAVADAMTRAEIAGRAERALRIYLAHGTTAIRTHVNVGGGAGLRGLEALVGLREKWRGIIDLQVVALVGSPFDGQGGQDLRRALKEGADVAGGAPHLDPQPDRAVRICLDIAGDAGTPVDLHADETLNPNMLTLATMADLVAETRFPFRVTASHCVSLAVQPRAVQQSVSEQVARAGIAVVALPHTNLFRQGRDLPVRTPRGLTAIRALRAAGVTLAAGGDNLRDPVNPVGRGDALEVAALMVTAGHLEPGEAIGSVTDAARTALGLPPVQVGPGCPADLVAIRAADAHEAVGAASPDRVAWRSGQVVARTTICSEISEPARDAPRLSAAGA